MKDLERNSLKALQKHYCRILLINRNLDSYYPIVLEQNEGQWDKIGCLSEFTRWFSDNGNIYEQDKPLFSKWVERCIINKENAHLFYRRKSNGEYRWAYVFVEQGDVPEEEYLYVRDVNDLYIEQCDLILDSVGEIDALTGLRNHFAYNIDKKPTDKVTFVNIDNLDCVCIENGYDACNEIIVSVADVMNEVSDNVYRISGDTFAILNCEDVEKLKDKLKGRARVN